MGRQKQSQFLTLRKRYFVSQAKAATTFGVTARTVRRWERKDAPRPVLAWLRIAYERDLGAIHEAWAGWHIGLDGRLYGPRHINTDQTHLRHHLETIHANA